MGMPPPMHEDDEDDDGPDLPQIDITGIMARVRKMGLGDYMYAIGAGLVAFREARKRRQEHDTRE